MFIRKRKQYISICDIQLLKSYASSYKDKLQQKENKEKEIREYIRKASYLQGNKILEEKELLEILDKGCDSNE